VRGPITFGHEISGGNCNARHTGAQERHSAKGTLCQTGKGGLKEKNPDDQKELGATPKGTRTWKPGKSKKKELIKNRAVPGDHGAAPKKHEGRGGEGGGKDTLGEKGRPGTRWRKSGGSPNFRRGAAWVPKLQRVQTT